MDRLTIGKTLEGFGFYGMPIYDRPILLKLERHGTVVCEAREMIDHFEFLVWKNPVSKEISQNVEEQYAGWRFFREGKTSWLFRTPDQKQVVVFTNKKDGLIPTGILLNNGTILIGIGLISILALKLRRTDMELSKVTIDELYKLVESTLWGWNIKRVRKSKSLIALGDISCLEEEVDIPNGVEHSFEKPHEGITVAYHRDRGESGCESRTTTLKQFAKDIEYAISIKMVSGNFMSYLGSTRWN